jgi:hypothetical protein
MFIISPEAPCTVHDNWRHLVMGEEGWFYYEYVRDRIWTAWDENPPEVENRTIASTKTMLTDRYCQRWHGRYAPLLVQALAVISRHILANWRFCIGAELLLRSTTTTEWHRIHRQARSTTCSTTELQQKPQDLQRGFLTRNLFKSFCATLNAKLFLQSKQSRVFITPALFHSICISVHFKFYGTTEQGTACALLSPPVSVSRNLSPARVGGASPHCTIDFFNWSAWRDSHYVSGSFQRGSIARYCCMSRSSSSTVHGV